MVFFPMWGDVGLGDLVLRRIQIAESEIGLGPQLDRGSVNTLGGAMTGEEFAEFVARMIAGRPGAAEYPVFAPFVEQM